MMAVPVGCWPNANAANSSRPRAFFSFFSGLFFGRPHAKPHAAPCGPMAAAPCGPMHRSFPPGPLGPWASWRPCLCCLRLAARWPRTLLFALGCWRPCTSYCLLQGFCQNPEFGFRRKRPFRLSASGARRAGSAGSSSCVQQPLHLHFTCLTPALPAPVLPCLQWNSFCYFCFCGSLIVYGDELMP